VSSVTRDPAPLTGGGPSLFSNNSDGDHGIATLSGDGDLTTVPNTMLMESPPRQITDGVQGAFSGADMTSNATGNPADKVPNLSGWVLWAGTSFSTPIITALAAAIQANEKANGNALLDPASLIKEVKRFADPSQPRGNLKCEIIYAYQQ
jgi:subtilisin family serine protease